LCNNTSVPKRPTPSLFTGGILGGDPILGREMLIPVAKEFYREDHSTKEFWNPMMIGNKRAACPFSYPIDIYL
jgi:hypothetical protein